MPSPRDPKEGRLETAVVLSLFAAGIILVLVKNLTGLPLWASMLIALGAWAAGSTLGYLKR